MLCIKPFLNHKTLFDDAAAQRLRAIHATTIVTTDAIKALLGMQSTVWGDSPHAA
jgi:hypothetical protein